MLHLLRYVSYGPLLLYDFLYKLLLRVNEPSLNTSTSLQSAIEEICPRLATAKCILLSMMTALNSFRHRHKLAQSIVELAAFNTCWISKLVQPAEESLQLHQNIIQLDSILVEVQAFVLHAIQSGLLLDEDLAIRHSDLTVRLTTILGMFQKAWSNERLYDAGHTERNDHTNIQREATRALLALDVGPYSEHGGQHHSDVPSFFSGAHHFVSNGGTYTSVLGNYTQIFSEEKSTSKGIIDGLRVLTDEDIALGREIYKGPGYRFYSAQSSGKIVVLKVYEGGHAKERCSKSAIFHRKIMHPNIPHMIAVSSSESDRSFLVFNGDYEGAVDQLLVQVLKKGLKQSLAVGMQIVSSLASGLNYLEDQKYPFATVPTLDHFILLNCKGKIIISFDPEDLDLDQAEGSESFRGSVETFHLLCQKTFESACKIHYESLEERRGFIDEFEADESDDDIPDAKLYAAEDHGPAVQSRQRPSDNHPALPPQFTPTATTLSSEADPIPTSIKIPAEKPRQKLKRSGRRWELVWRPPALAQDVSLDEISRNFQSVGGDELSASTPSLNRRRGRYKERTPHRCPGYSRIEITLTTEISRSAIVSHSSPTPHEICPVCKEVVKDAEIFNCICGGEDDESMPTIRCSNCFEWHHRPCVDFMDVSSDNFLCPDCKGYDDSSDGFQLSGALSGSALLTESDHENNYTNVISRPLSLTRRRRLAFSGTDQILYLYLWKRRSQSKKGRLEDQENSITVIDPERRRDLQLSHPVLI